MVSRIGTVQNDLLSVGMIAAKFEQSQVLTPPELRNISDMCVAEDELCAMASVPPAPRQPLCRGRCCLLAAACAVAYRQCARAHTNSNFSGQRACLARQ